MPQKTSPFLETKYGWSFGESGWNVGMDENLVKFSFLHGGVIDDIVSTLPSTPVEGSSYFLTTDKRVYFVVELTYYSTPLPIWFELKVKSTGEVRRFNGNTLEVIPEITQVASQVASLESLTDTITNQITSIEDDINSLGSAAQQSTEFFAKQDEFEQLSSTVQSNSEQIEELSSLSSIESKAPLFVDMHYGASYGVGWTTADEPTNGTPENIKSTTVTEDVAAGPRSYNIPVVSTTGFAAGMLVVYLAEDDKYYSAKIHEIVGNTIRLGTGVKVNIAQGSPLYNFYRDDAHPNLYGGASIVDYALSSLTNAREKTLVLSAPNSTFWSGIVGAATTSQVTTSTYANPGTTADGVRSLLVNGTNVGDGVYSDWFGLETGDYCLSLAVNPGLRSPNFDNTVNVTVQESSDEGVISTIATAQYSASDTTLLTNLKFSTRTSGTLRISVTTINSGPLTFTVGPLRIYSEGVTTPNLYKGKHVFLGDSWFSTISGMYARFNSILTSSGAEVINAGVSGNTIDQLIARFDTDVRVHAPHYVWVMCGTNDYYAGTSASHFEQKISTLKSLIQSIGAKPIFFNASVGSLIFSGGDRLERSRQYAAIVKYSNSSTVRDTSSSLFRSSNFYSASVTVPASSSVVIGVSPGTTRDAAVIRRIVLSSSAVNVNIGYGGDLGGTTVTDNRVLSGSSSYKEQMAPRTADRQAKLVIVKLSNPTASSVSVAYTLDLLWKAAI